MVEVVCWLSRALMYQQHLHVSGCPQRGMPISNLCWHCHHAGHTGGVWRFSTAARSSIPWRKLPHVRSLAIALLPPKVSVLLIYVCLILCGSFSGILALFKSLWLLQFPSSHSTRHQKRWACAGELQLAFPFEICITFACLWCLQDAGIEPTLTPTGHPTSRWDRGLCWSAGRAGLSFGCSSFAARGVPRSVPGECKPFPHCFFDWISCRHVLRNH